MQLGARWLAGDAPHRSVPDSLHQAIRSAEVSEPDAKSWTLTWLEGRPRAALDDALLVYVDAAGAIPTETQTTSRDIVDVDDDSWLD